MYFLNHHFNSKNPFVKRLEDDEALKRIYLDSIKPSDKELVHGSCRLNRLSPDSTADLLLEVQPREHRQDRSARAGDWLSRQATAQGLLRWRRRRHLREEIFPSKPESPARRRSCSRNSSRLKPRQTSDTSSRASKGKSWAASKS